MKKYILIILCTISLVGLYQCKNSKNASSSAENRLLVAAQKRWPDATSKSLSDGHNIYMTKCTQCHGAKEIEDYTEERWNPILDNMARKAKLTDVEKETVKQYIIATLDLSKAKK